MKFIEDESENIDIESSIKEKNMYTKSKTWKHLYHIFNKLRSV